ncbi:MAG: DNA polymerase III [Planctomycetia bacterium]|nr:DNA polymerase III [Planctomycetia bacterium]
MVQAANSTADLLPLDNQAIAARLYELAELLENRQVNPFRVRAYHTAAETVRDLDHPVHEILARDGIAALTELPGIGESLAHTIERLTTTGKLPLLSQLRGHSGGEALLATVAGIGPKTAARIHHELHVESLEDLEAAACDGRLARLPGMGPKRVRAVRDSLAGRFRNHKPPALPAMENVDQPPIADLLSIDNEFRRKSESNRLLQVAPLRFNPTGAAWLPILHTHRGDKKYTALLSNTPRAHELGTNHDWLVIFRERRDGGGRWTVITSRFGPLNGRRIVRGRESECAAHYACCPAPSHVP